ncbi:MAG: transcription termination/antitermination protein NusG [Abditibacteriales bacterium]|nr:transcription termination/antitermination protein NusG [Abditibacteriales bacterium]MDW8365659.1 transcription termination/antitermination protein NusG [Abditibacteriales bacterium]
MPKRQWYLVHTYPGQEDKIKTNIERRVKSQGLEERISRVLVPTEEEVKIRGGKRQIVKRKVFPGYVLIEMEMDKDTWHFIRQTVGVTGFVGASSMEGDKFVPPPPMRQADVEAVLKSTDPMTSRPKPVWHRGEIVRVISGPFADSTGKVEDVNVKSEKLTVMISVFGREVPVELDFAQIEKV